jgi:hypothetical protein
LLIGDFVAALIAHHDEIQKRKPPAGKASWFEQANGKIGIRPIYRLDSAPRDPERYIFFYRTGPIYSFLKALEKR